MAPRLDRRMELQGLSRLPDGAGGFTETWVPLGLLWAEVRPGAGRDGSADLVATSELPLRITVRAAPVSSLARVRPGQRLVEGTRRYRVVAVAEAGALYLTCHAREEAAQ